MKILVPEVEAARAPQYPCSLLHFGPQLDYISKPPLKLGVTMCLNLGQWNMNRLGLTVHHFHFFAVHPLSSEGSRKLGEARAISWKEPGSLNDCIFDGF